MPRDSDCNLVLVNGQLQTAGYAKGMKALVPSKSPGMAPLTNKKIEELLSEPHPAPKPLLNKTETRFRDILIQRGKGPILEQAITLRLDPPFKSYRPDLAILSEETICFYEVKGPHRFREKGIAKVALAAKTYPMFTFVLADWTGKEWKELTL